MRNRPRDGTLADLSGLGIDDVHVTDGTARIGGAATFTNAAKALAAAHPDHILAKALYDACSPALRNRITIGGSLALFPPWSSVVGPLVALEAELTLVGATNGTFPVSEYVGNRELGEKTAITEIRVDVSREWESHWYRFGPTHFNYPLFTVVVLTELNGTSISDCRIVLTGNRGRFKRLVQLEDEVRGAEQPDITVTPATLGTAFPDRQGFGGEYLAHLASVEVTRGLRGAQRSMS